MREAAIEKETEASIVGTYLAYPCTLGRDVRAFVQWGVTANTTPQRFSKAIGFRLRF